MIIMNSNRILLLAAVVFMLFLYGCSEDKKLEKPLKLGCCDPETLGTEANPNCNVISTQGNLDGFEVSHTNSCDETKGVCNVTITYPKDDPSTGIDESRTKDVDITICSDTVAQCYQPQCNVQVCGPFVYDPQATPSYGDLQKLQIEAKFSPEKLSTPATKIRNINLLSAACVDLPMDGNLTNLFNNAKGSFMNSYRFGIGSSFAEFEKYRYILPLSDVFCGFAEATGQHDRFMNYLLTPQQYAQKGEYYTKDIIENPGLRSTPGSPFYGLTFPFEQYQNVSFCPTKSAGDLYGIYHNPDGVSPDTINQDYYANLLPIMYQKELVEGLRGPIPSPAPFECDNPVSCQSNQCSFDTYHRNLCKTVDNTWVDCECSGIKCDSASTFVANKPTSGASGLQDRLNEYGSGQKLSFRMPKQVSFRKYEFDFDTSYGSVWSGYVFNSKECTNNGQKVTCSPNPSEDTGAPCRFAIGSTSLPDYNYMWCSAGGPTRRCTSSFYYNNPPSVYMCNDAPGGVTCGVQGQNVYFKCSTNSDGTLACDNGYYYGGSGGFDVDASFANSFDPDIYFFGSKSVLGNIGFTMLDEEDFKETNLFTNCRMTSRDYEISDLSYNGDGSSKTEASDGTWSSERDNVYGPDQLHPPDPNIPENYGMYLDRVGADGTFCDDVGRIYIRNEFILIKSLGRCELDENFLPVTKPLGWCESCTVATFAKQKISLAELPSDSNQLIQNINQLGTTQEIYLSQGIQPVLDIRPDSNWNGNTAKTELFSRKVPLVGYLKGPVNINGSSILIAVDVSQENAASKVNEIYEKTKSASLKCGNCRISVLLENGAAQSLPGKMRVGMDINTTKRLIEARSDIFNYTSVITYKMFPVEFTNEDPSLCGDDTKISNVVYDSAQYESSKITEITGKPSLLSSFYIDTSAGGDCWKRQTDASGNPTYDPYVKTLADLIGKQSGLTSVGFSGMVYSDVSDLETANNPNTNFCSLSRASRFVTDKPFLLYSKIYTMNKSDATCQECSLADISLGFCTRKCSDGIECALPEDADTVNNYYRCPDRTLAESEQAGEQCAQCSDADGKLNCAFSYDTGIIKNFNYNVNDLNELYPDVVSSIPYGNTCCFEDKQGNFSYFKENKFKPGALPLIYSDKGQLNDGCGFSDLDLGDTQSCGVDLPTRNYKVSCKLDVYSPGCTSSEECVGNSICQQVVASPPIGACRILDSGAGQCKDPSFCPAGKDCVSNQCAFRAGYCTSDGHCTSSKYCDRSTNTCTNFAAGQCNSDINCGAGLVCNTVAHACVPLQSNECFTDLHCIDSMNPFGFCDTSTNTCKRPTEPGDCNTISGSYGEIRCTGAQCNPQTHKCDLTSTCSEYNCPSRDGYYCSETGSCEQLAIGACNAYSRDSDGFYDYCQPGEACNGITHTCQLPCTDNYQCPSGSYCSAGSRGSSTGSGDCVPLDREVAQCIYDSDCGLTAKCSLSGQTGPGRCLSIGYCYTSVTEQQCYGSATCVANPNHPFGGPDGLCQLPSGSTQCRFDYQCSFNEKCDLSSNICAPLNPNECTSDFNCPSGTICLMNPGYHVGNCQALEPGQCRSHGDCDYPNGRCDFSTHNCQEVPADFCDGGGIRGDEYCDQQARPACDRPDSQCGYCDVQSQQCKLLANGQCFNNYQCSPGTICNLNTNRCVAGCDPDDWSSCPAGQICDQNTRQCITGCRYDINCPENYVCSQELNRCVQCRDTFDCSTGDRRTCDAGTNTCIECTSDISCQTSRGNGYVCDQSTKSCVQLTLTSETGSCRNDQDCPYYSNCDIATHSCRSTSSCSFNDQCASGNQCVDGQCTALQNGACFFNDDCEQGQVCTGETEGSAGTCSVVACTSGSQCRSAGSYVYCNRDTGSCESSCSEQGLGGEDRRIGYRNPETGSVMCTDNCLSNADCANGFTCQPSSSDSRIWACQR